MPRAGAAGRPQHMVGLAQVTARHGHRAAQPRGIGQCGALAMVGNPGLEGREDRLGLAQVTGADQRPDLRRAPPERARVS